MKIDVLESTNKKLIFELEGTDNTFCNALKEELRNDSGVTVSAYNISHPLVGKPKFFIETNKETTPKAALEKAVAELKKKNNAFAKAFDGLK
ncbi:MAG: DNA-directed RNA polymerase subunit L [Candidatus Woesearchaeota archaeon]|jgi:DNA-directed RNA polymerase subunit L